MGSSETAKAGSKQPTLTPVQVGGAVVATAALAATAWVARDHLTAANGSKLVDAFTAWAAKHSNPVTEVAGQETSRRLKRATRRTAIEALKQTVQKAQVPGISGGDKKRDV